MDVLSVQDFKEKMLGNLEVWAESRIDSLAEANPHLRVISVYVKRGLHNYIAKSKGRIGEVVDRAAMFLCDEDGNVNAETLFDDAMSLFRTVPETQVDIPPVNLTVGKGSIRISLPESPFSSLLFGETRSIRITEDDLMELKRMLAG